jgi:hypothetical protein
MDSKQARRRLLKGSLAAPLVMTVAPSTYAAQSSFTACLARGAGDTKPSLILAAYERSDEWLRVPVEIYKVFVLNKKGEPVEQDGTYFLGPDKLTFFKLDKRRPESEEPKQITEFNALTPGLTKTLAGQRYALAYVTDRGSVVGFAWQSNGGTHCRHSCWASVKFANKIV